MAASEYGHHISVGSVVTTDIKDFHGPKHGIVRWMGHLPGMHGLCAGVELVSLFTYTFV